MVNGNRPPWGVGASNMPSLQTTSLMVTWIGGILLLDDVTHHRSLSSGGFRERAAALKHVNGAPKTSKLRPQTAQV